MFGNTLQSHPIKRLHFNHKTFSLIHTNFELVPFPPQNHFPPLSKSNPAWVHSSFTLFLPRSCQIPPISQPGPGADHTLLSTVPLYEGSVSSWKGTSITPTQDVFIQSGYSGFFHKKAWTSSKASGRPGLVRVQLVLWEKRKLMIFWDLSRGAGIPFWVGEETAQVSRCHVHSWSRNISPAKSPTTASWRVRTVQETFYCLAIRSDLVFFRVCRGMWARCGFECELWDIRTILYTSRTYFHVSPY